MCVCVCVCVCVHVKSCFPTRCVHSAAFESVVTTHTFTQYVKYLQEWVHQIVRGTGKLSSPEPTQKAGGGQKFGHSCTGTYIPVKRSTHLLWRITARPTRCRGIARVPRVRRGIRHSGEVPVAAVRSAFLQFDP